MNEKVNGKSCSGGRGERIRGEKLQGKKYSIQDGRRGEEKKETDY
jgi:hypothetical protein